MCISPGAGMEITACHNYFDDKTAPSLSFLTWMNKLLMLLFKLLLLLLSRFSRVRLCETPETAAHQAPPSLGVSRQEHWSGLPFPSLMHESEKWKWSRSVVSDSSRPHGLQPTRLLRPWDFPGKNTGVGCHCLLRLFKLNPTNSFTPLQKWGHLVVMVILLKGEVYPCRM